MKILFSVFRVRAYEEVAIEAIKHALKALRKRHLLEEGAHAPALAALNRPLVLQVPYVVAFLFFRSSVIWLI